MTEPIKLGPTLETARLILRPPEPGDFEPYAAFMGDGEALQRGEERRRPVVARGRLRVRAAGGI